VPVGVFALAISTAVFPHLSDHFAKKDLPAFTALLRQSVVRILFFMLPITVWLLLLRAHAVRILYGAGQFSWDNTKATFAVLGVLAFSLVGQSLVPLFARALLARHNTWAPVMANLTCIVINILASFALVGRYGVVGVAAGYAIAVSINSLLLYGLLRPELASSREGMSSLHAEEREFLRGAWKIVFSSTALALSTYGALYAIEPFVNTRTWIGLVVQSGVAVGVGGLVYVACTVSLQVPDAKVLKAFLFRFLRVAPRP
jgi:putative peptidoglycan lipid II flippase